MCLSERFEIGSLPFFDRAGYESGDEKDRGIEGLLVMTRAIGQFVVEMLLFSLVGL